MKTIILTSDYADLEEATRHLMGRMTTAPQAAKDAAKAVLGELNRLQDGVLTIHNVWSVAYAAHMAATANFAHYDEAAQAHLQCCAFCAARPETPGHQCSPSCLAEASGRDEERKEGDR